MTVPNTLLLIALLFALLALIGLVATVGAVKKRRVFGTALTLLTEAARKTEE